MKAKESSFQFIEYYIDYLTYKQNKEFKEKNFNLPIQVNFDLKKSNVDFEKKTALVTLIIKIFESVEKAPFSIDLSITGKFMGEEDMTKEVFDNMCNINAPAILFPYIRTIINTLTSQSGYPPLTLPLINIQKTIKS